MDIKETKILFDGKQTRSAIPKKFVEEFDINTMDKIKWVSNKGELKGELKKNE